MYVKKTLCRGYFLCTRSLLFSFLIHLFRSAQIILTDNYLCSFGITRSVWDTRVKLLKVFHAAFKNSLVLFAVNI